MQDYLNTTTQNISWFCSQYNNDSLILGPSFQRNKVWTDKQKSYLVDSILQGYPIPELYLQEVVTSAGNTTFIVVDGQQRIRSFLEFYKGDLSLAEGETKEKWENATFEDLTEKEKKDFFGYKFVVRMLPEISEQETRSIFARINKNNEALNNQELRQATYSGGFIKTINEISNKSYWNETGLFTPVKIRRMLDAESISEMAIAFLNGHQNKKDKLDSYYALYEESFDQEEDLICAFDLTVREILSIIPSIKKTRWKKLTDFYTLFHVLSQYTKEDALPLTKDIRRVFSEGLIDFGIKVDKLQTAQKASTFEEKDFIGDPFYPFITNYAAGIRASTDLGSRRQRFETMQKFLLHISESKEESQEL